ncbi:MAG: phosphate ABC transporter permease subunit PstC [Myxococcales bacterium FL481]|nr:MAG: phosphate ABC transporter permease subunit PstC [Myxococcales bacterium FL481]
MRRRRASKTSERLIEASLAGCGLVSLLTTVGIVAVLAGETFAFFSDVSLADFLFDTQWTPLFAEKHFGIWPLFGGTVLTTTIAMVVAIPFGLAAAVYLSEYAAPGQRRVLKPALEVLAGVPTIVYGYFALIVLTPALQAVVPDLAGFNALSPGIMMGIMIMPLISSLSEDALRAVPGGLREAALGLGASKLTTIFRVVLPSAMSGISSAAILAVSRAVGETMIVTIAAGQQPRLTLDPRVPVETMTAYIVQVSMGDVPTGTPEYRTIFAVAAALFLLTAVMNLASDALRRKFKSERSDG